MLTTLSDAPNQLNAELKKRITHLSLGLYGYTFPIETDKGTLNYCAEDTKEPATISDRTDITLFHVLDSSDVVDGSFRQDQLTYAIVCATKTKVNSFDAYLKGLLLELRPAFSYFNAEYTHSNILSTYNIDRNLFNWQKLQLFVIRYQARIPITNCSNLCC